MSSLGSLGIACWLGHGVPCRMNSNMWDGLLCSVISPGAPNVFLGVTFSVQAFCGLRGMHKERPHGALR